MGVWPTEEYRGHRRQLPEGWLKAMAVSESSRFTAPKSNAGKSSSLTDRGSKAEGGKTFLTGFPPPVILNLTQQHHCHLPHRPHKSIQERGLF